MFEKIGRKLAQGAKAEMLKPVKAGTDGNDILSAILKVGLFLCMLGVGLHGSKSPEKTIVINNYIYKEDRNDG